MTQEDNSNADSSPQKARKVGMLTDVGQVRTVDEDSILVADLSFGVNSKSSNFHLLVVADGMGGHAKGEEASKIALSAISRSVISELVNDTPFTKLLEQGIETGTHYKPIHNLSFYKKSVKLPATEKISKEIVTIPIHPNLSDADIDKIITTVNKFA